MHALRSRTGVVSITAAAAFLLALPVVAAGQVPGVGQVVGGARDTAESIAPITVAPAPSADTPVAPGAGGPMPAPGGGMGRAPSAPGPAGAPSEPARGGPAESPAVGAPSASAPRGGRPAGSAPAGARRPAAEPRASASGSAAGSGSSKASVAAQGGGASQDGSGGESAGSDTGSAMADLPDDASADTLPFTGLQLGLVLMSGLAALAGGIVLRRSARGARR